MAITLAKYIFHQFFDNSGLTPLAGGKLYTYAGGTTNNKQTHQDAAGSAQHPNPIVLDSAGRVPAGLFLDSGAYKFVLKDADDVTIKTIDNVTGQDTTNSVDSLDDLKALSVGGVSLVQTLGYTSKGDGGHSLYYYDSSSSATADDFSVIMPNSNPVNGRWILLHGKEIRARQGGVVLNGTTDDVARLQIVDTYCNANNISIIIDGAMKLNTDPSVLSKMILQENGSIVWTASFSPTFNVSVDRNSVSQHFNCPTNYEPNINTSFFVPEWFGENSSTHPKMTACIIASTKYANWQYGTNFTDDGNNILWSGEHAGVKAVDLKADNTDVTLTTYNGDNLVLTSAGLITVNGVTTFNDNVSITKDADEIVSNFNVRNTSTGTSAGTYATIGNNVSANGATFLLYGGNHATYPNQFHIFNQHNASLVLGANGAAAVYLTGGGLLGVGNSTPNFYNSSARDIVVGNHSGTHGITICTGNTSAGNIFFSDGTTGNEAYRGQFAYDHSTDKFTWITAATGANIMAFVGGKLGVSNSDPKNHIHISTRALMFQPTNETVISNNLYYDAGNYKYCEAAAGSIAYFNAGQFEIYTAPSGVVDATATLTNRLLMTEGGITTITTNINGVSCSILNQHATNYTNFLVGKNITGDGIYLVYNNSSANPNRIGGLVIGGDSLGTGLVVQQGGKVGINTSTAVTDLQIGTKTTLQQQSGGQTNLAQNSYHDGTNHKYITTAATSILSLVDEDVYIYSAVSGTAGTNITYTENCRFGPTYGVKISTKSTLQQQSAGYTNLANNSYHDGANHKYITTDKASLISMQGNIITFYSVGSGTAGTNITYEENMRIGPTALGGVQIDVDTYISRSSDGSLSIFHVRNPSTGTNAATQMRLGNNNGYSAYLTLYGGNHSTMADEFHISNTYNNDIVFNTNNNERVRILNDGKVGINIDTPSEYLDVDGNGRFRSIGSGTSAGALHYTSDGTLTTNTSDIRLKTNIEPIYNALHTLAQITGYNFEWKKDKKMGTQSGLIAQNVAGVFPTGVFKNPVDGYMGVHSNAIIALLVEAVKELKQLITERN